MTPEEKLINEALMNDQNGNMDNYQHQHQYHDNYSHLQSPSSGGTNNQQSSPRHHQNGGHGRLTNNDPVLLSSSSSSAAKTGSSGSGSPAGAGGKQRRVNIGKMFQTHICYVCDARLAKLDCIKMHFKNRHPETSLDLNKVMISRVVCYLCGVRKKEYAILNRHFQVEHRGVEIDPFQIGMDAPTPFNLSPEEEADLVKLPIPEPVKQEDMKRVRSFMERVDRAATTNSAEMNDNTMDSMDSTSINDMSFEQQVKEAEVEQHQSPNAAFHHSASTNNHIELQTSITTKSNTNTNVFNHHSTISPGSDNTNVSDPSSRKKPRKTRGFKNNKCLICGKTFSRITTLKKHFNEQHSNELYDKSKIEITQLPCYMCEAKFTDSRHAIRHFETNHSEVEYDTYKIQVPGLEMTNGANDDYDQEDDVNFDNNGANNKNTSGNNINISNDDAPTSTEEFSKKTTKYFENNTIDFTEKQNAADQESNDDGNSSSSSSQQNHNQKPNVVGGFQCYLCNYWCSTLADFRAHFSPENKAHEHIISQSIICPLCQENVESTDDMFDHVTKKHCDNNANDSLNNKAAPATNCVESC